MRTRNGFGPYLPRLIHDWAASGDRSACHQIEGSLVSADISGFTRLSERLMRKGKVGAEELILLISGCFEGLIGIASRHGGDVLKFRGDALLLLFSGEGHERRACGAANDMQWFIETAAPTRSSVGQVALRMSVGVHSGPCHFFLVGSTHRELVVTGPAATATIRLESGARHGQVLLSPETASALDRSWLGPEREDGRLLRRREPGDVEAAVATAAPAFPVDGLEEFVPAPLRSALAAGVEPEHRQVTAAFVRYSGSDGVIETEGPEALLDRLDALGRVAGDTAADLGLTWLESDIDVDGGKLYLTAGAPTTTGNDDESMLRALRTIVAADVGLGLRAGVNRGLAFAGDVGASTRRTYAVTGDTVNLAARVTARAAAGEILATAAVLDRVTTAFETDARPLLVKGKERAVTAYAIGAVTGARRDERTHELPLVGREAELEIFRAAVEAARRRRSQLIELVGDPGIGKSRLVEELKTMAVGFQQLLAHGEPYTASTPYRALRDVLRPLAGITPEQTAAEAGEQLKPWIEAVLPDLAPWLPLVAIPFDASVPSTPEVDGIDQQFIHERLHHALDQFLTRVLMMPTLILVEDAHWLDEASAYLFGHLMAQPSSRPWLVCVTRRPEGRGFVTGDSGTLLELAPLDGEAAAKLAVAAAGDFALAEDEIAAVSERSGGNPLFVRELVNAAADDAQPQALPQTVETLMTARIDTLDPADRTLLRYASVVGPSFDLSLLEEILADIVDNVAELARWDRLGEFVGWEGPDRLVFRHDLFRAAAYEGLSLRRRRVIHGRLGETLERRAGDHADEEAALLSLHFFEAQAYEPAWRYAVLAGHHAKRTFANVVAAELFERALAAARAIPNFDPAQTAAVYEALGEVCELFASYDRADTAYARARSLVPDDALLQGRLLLKEGRVREAVGKYAVALRWYGRALRRAEQLGDDEEALSTRVEIELAYASVRHRQGRFEDEIDWCMRAAEHAEAAGYRAGLAHAYYLLDRAHMRLGRPATEYRTRALPIYEEIGDLVGQARVLNNLGIDAYYEGRWDDAIELYARFRDLARRAGDVVYAAIATNNIAELLSDQGKLEEATELLAESLRAFRAARFPLGIHLATANLARVAARSRRFEESVKLLREAREGLTEIGSESSVQEADARLAEAHVLAGEYREAQRVAQHVAQRAAGTAIAAAAERQLGYALVQARQRERAAPHFERSLALARELGNRYEEALTLKALADTGAADAAALRAQSESIRESLGVVEVPSPPLP